MYAANWAQTPAPVREEPPQPSPTVSGEQTCHEPLKFHWGCCVPTCGTETKRMPGNFAAACSRSSGRIADVYQ